MRGDIALIAALLLLRSSCATPPDQATTPTGSDKVVRTSGVLDIAGVPHPYLVEGKGVPCVVAGMAPFYSSVFSDHLKQHIQFVFVDFKNTWMAESLEDVDHITMRTLVDEIDDVRNALGFGRICVLGHSTPGFIGLEYALSYPDRISHVIAIGTPPFFNAHFSEVQEAFWTSGASHGRKALMQKNRERLPDELIRSLSQRDQLAMRYVRNGPLYWWNPEYDSYWFWAGRHFNIQMVDHFFTVILNAYDPRAKLQRISAPVFLALGRYDYAIPYYLWDDLKTELPNLSYHLFEKSGHFPMLEQQTLFDSKLIEWLEDS